ncbi:MAG: glycosyl hydrolase family 28-related protein, partial [Armatimonadetes bacterium]|nr:glycosyl hydrolase family 28-related protein [Armatimonadota bacterium]
MKQIAAPFLFLVVFVSIVAPSGIAHSDSGYLNVRDFGAKGDGLTDDTAAFQSALDEMAKQGGGIVTLSAGKYLIKTHLAIPRGVTLEGTWRAPACATEYHDPKDPKGGPLLIGSVLLAVEGAGNPDGTPFIYQDRNSTLKGVTIFYPEQTKTNPPIAYPWTVATIGADNCSIIDCLLVNPYQAVDFGTRVSGRHFIRNLYGQPLYKGLYVDMCIDIGRIENVHFWPFWTAADADSPVAKFMLEKGEAFIFGRSDWEYVSNSFAISYKVGIKFVRGRADGPFAGGGNYLLTQSGADCCDMAVLVEETQGHSGVSFSNSQIFGDIIVKDTNNGMVRFTGCG